MAYTNLIIWGEINKTILLKSVDSVQENRRCSAVSPTNRVGGAIITFMSCYLKGQVEGVLP